MNVPDDRRYTEEHEWVLPADDGTVRIGITDYAQDALGDVVFVDLPEAGREATAGESVAEVESTKSVSEIYAPIAGSIAAVNGDLDASPEMVNDDPSGRGWFFAMTPSDPSEVDGLLDAAAYLALLD